MGEEFQPDQPPVVDESAGHVQVEYIGDSAEQSVPVATGNADIEPGAKEVLPGEEVAQTDDPDAGRVQDESKAWDMAHAGDDYRTKAVANRDILRKEEEGHAVRRQHDKLRDQPSLPVWKFRERQQRSEEQQALLDESNEIAKVAHKEDGMAYKEASKDFPTSDRTWFTDTRANLYDEEAAKLEEWAAILHDQPVSEEFKEKYAIDPSPQSLTRIEQDIARQQDALKFLESRLQTGFLDVSVGTGRYTNSEWEFKQLLDGASDEDHAEYEAMNEELYKAAERANSFVAKLYTEQKVQPLRDKIGIMQGVLNDIRTGNTHGQSQN